MKEKEQVAVWNQMRNKEKHMNAKTFALSDITTKSSLQTAKAGSFAQRETHTPHKPQQMGQKRPRSDTMDAPEAQQSPFMPMFETFRAELDEHHDRRERTIKASRDITAASKKMSVP